MKRSVKFLLCLTFGLALMPFVRAAINDSPGANKTAADTGEPYEAIWLRNVFDLRPPPPPPTNSEVAPATPPPTIHLTGIMTILGRKEALFMIQDQPTPGKPPEKQRSLIMVEGERREKLEVLEIDPKTRKVKIKLDEAVFTVTFETNKTASPGGPAPMPNPQFNPPPGLQPPNFTPRPPVAGGVNSGFQQQREIRSPAGTQITPQGNYGGYGVANTANTGGGANGANIGGLFNAQQSTGGNQVVDNGLSGEQNTALFLLNNQAHAAEIQAGKYPPPPPIPGLNDNSSANQSGNANNTSANSTGIPPIPQGSRTWTRPGSKSAPPAFPGQ
jgi:hypothetical protein